MRIVETQDEAEDPDHCWCGNSRIYDHLKVVGVNEGYPALLIRWMDIEERFRTRRHGSKLLDFAEEFSFLKSCAFCYCKLDMNEDHDLELQRFYIERGWKLIEETTQKRILEPDPEAGFVMAYKEPGSAKSSGKPEYRAEADTVPEWELEFDAKRYISPN